MHNIYKELELTMLKNKYHSYTHPPYELEQKLMQYIKQMDLDKCKEILDKINSLERARLSNFPLNSLKYSLVASCTLFTRAVITSGLDSETAFMLSDFFINLIDQTKNEKELQLLEYKMVEDFIKILKSQKEYIYNPIINRVIFYIKKNIENKLSLREIASYVNVHPNYLSSAFKKEVKKNITEYIAEQKIYAIKLYLTNSNLKINEISYIFNFKNTTYFCNYFKNHTGFTPKEYRKQYNIY